MAKELWYVEMTDTFGGEANYSWVNRFKVRAASERGAILKFNREVQCGMTRKAWDDGNTVRYNMQGMCICVFVSPWDEGHDHYTNVKVL